MTYTAHCLCSGIQFRIEGELAPIQVCHCAQCRRAQGSAFAANVPVAESAVRYEYGQDLLAEYESSPGKIRTFCRRCGSPIHSRRDEVPGVLRIRAGLINEPLSVPVAFHAYVTQKANWFDIRDDAPHYPEGAPPAP